MYTNIVYFETFCPIRVSENWTAEFKGFAQELKGKVSYLSSDGRPDFERVVIRAADNQVATELKAGDDVIVVTFQHLQNDDDKDSNINPCLWESTQSSFIKPYHGFTRVPLPPVGFYAMLTNVGRFPGADGGAWPHALSTTIRQTFWYTCET